MAYKIRTIKPLKLSQNRLPLQFSIIVPSKSISGKPIKPSTFTERVKSEKKWMDRIFKGDTAVKTIGSYVERKKIKSGKNKGKFKDTVIVEKGSLVEVSTTPEVFEENKKKMENHIRERQKQWRQSSIFYKIEGESFIYPYQEQIPTTKSKAGITIN
jgi:hypothetical protein